MKELDFEKYKLAEYVCNILHRVKSRKDKNRICEWLEDDGVDVFGLSHDGKRLSSRRWENRKDDESEREEAREAFLKNAEQTLRRDFLKKKTELSDIERVLTFIAKAMGLDETESEYVGLIARYALDRNVESLIDSVSSSRAVFGKDLQCEWFLSAKTNRDNLRCIWRKVAEYGLTDKDFESYVSVSGFTCGLLLSGVKTYEEFRRIFIGKAQSPELKWEDFDYVENRDELAALLRAAAARKEKGVNILLYGSPGTGKTEFARVLARRAGVRLYSVAEEKKNEHKPEDRAAALLFSQKVSAAQKNVCLLMDEAEDVFFNRRSEMSKIGMNGMLENNETPVIWTTNRILDADPAFLRRFSFSSFFELPDRKHSVRIWQKVLRKNKLPYGEEVAGEMADCYTVPPAFITNAVKNERLIGGGIKTVKKSIENMRQLCDGICKKKPERESGHTADEVPFDPALLNTDVDLERLAVRITELREKNFSLCLYGAPGTGKSAYAVRLAGMMGIPVLKKRCSDILNKYVGESEQNIRAAFEEAADKKALLIFDEADSFLQDRRDAVRSWETALVNEMLTQMEQAEHPFVCTTNLIERLDQAALRRFTFKVKYDFLTAEQRTRAFEVFFGIKDVDLSDAENLTPADFALVRKKARILGIENERGKLLKMLRSEQAVKVPPKNKIGF